jgi:hypothetical protein
MTVHRAFRQFEEVAAALKVTPRWLRDTIRARAIPVLRAGRRTIRFDDRALAALTEALRPNEAGRAREPQPVSGSESPALTPGRGFFCRLSQVTVIASTLPYPARRLVLKTRGTAYAVRPARLCHRAEKAR